MDGGGGRQLFPHMCVYCSPFYLGIYEYNNITSILLSISILVCIILSYEYEHDTYYIL